MVAGIFPPYFLSNYALPKLSRYAYPHFQYEVFAHIASPISTHYPSNPTDGNGWAGGMSDFKQVYVLPRRFPGADSS